MILAPVPVAPTVVLGADGVYVVLAGMEWREETLVGMSAMGMCSWN